ncbi:ankyrin repeat domain-containing protein [Verrucomicrobiota bacterium]
MNTTLVYLGVGVVGGAVLAYAIVIFGLRQGPLWMACHYGLKTLARLLIDKGADMEARDRISGFTPLHVAAMGKRVAILRLLVQKGANVNAKDNTGWTPLHWAAIEGPSQSVMLLVQNGADVNVMDNQGWTPLHRAAIEDNVETLDALLQSGAQVSVRTHAGATPLVIAIRCSSRRAAEVLRSQGGSE